MYENLTMAKYNKSSKIRSVSMSAELITKSTLLK